MNCGCACGGSASKLSPRTKFTLGRTTLLRLLALALVLALAQWFALSTAGVLLALTGLK